jgi:uncharacterized protein (DUF1697 family)
MTVQDNFHFIAFLRGINVGGHTRVRMADLKKAFENAGFERVRTVLASGNVVFASGISDKKVLAGAIESSLKTAIGKNIGVVVLSFEDLRKIRFSDPFKGIVVTPDTRLLVTFLTGGTGPRTISLPYTSPKGEFMLLCATAGAVFSVVDLAKGKGTTDLMNLIEKEFGTDSTTRNWNTVLKVLS